MNKRGSHVGRILSFVIFVLFIVYIFSILRPAANISREKQNMLDYLENEIKENLTLQIRTLMINISDNPNNCVWVNNFINDMGDARMILLNESGQSVEIYQHSSANHLFINRSNPSEIIFKVEIMDIAPITANNLCTGNAYRVDYTLRSNVTKEYLYSGRVLELIDIYNSDYEGIKTAWGVPESTEFNFLFTYENGTEIGPIQTEPNTNIFAEEMPLIYLNESMENEAGFLTIKVW